MNIILSKGLAERVTVMNHVPDHTGLNQFVMQKAEVSMNVGMLDKLPLLCTSS